MSHTSTIYALSSTLHDFHANHEYYESDDHLQFEGDHDSENNAVNSIKNLIVSSSRGNSTYSQAEAEQLRSDYLMLISQSDWKEKLV